MSTSEGKGSPTKGKVSNDGRWRTNWWDFQNLVDDVRRPVAWSSSSTLFTAHPTQPIVIGRLFSSSKQFLVVSPDPILRSPTTYGPPTVISVSPDDHWLFAFFSSNENDGIACLWNRGSCVDAWIVKEYWPFSRGAGVIACAWAGTEREWSTSADGSSFRLPTSGPLTPVSNPTLLLVTQAHQLRVYYFPTYIASSKMLFCSLTQPYFTAEGQPLGAYHSIPSGPKTSRLCVYAAIGFIYGESSILVAMRSRRYPTSDNLKPAAYSDLELGISLDLPQSHESFSEEEVSSLEWGTLSEEQTIELCEVKLRFDGMYMSVHSQPLSPLYHPMPHMSCLTFVCSPPPRLDPSASPRTSPKRDKQPMRLVEPSPTFLVASFLDFEEYNSIPKSSVVAYTLARSQAVGYTDPDTLGNGGRDLMLVTTDTLNQVTRQVGERSFFPRVLTLLYPGSISTCSRRRGLVVLLADSGGPVSRGSQKAKEVAVGNIAVLRLPDLANDREWEQLPIMTPISRVGIDWPVNIVTSRNQVLLSAITMCRMTIHTLPKQLANTNTSISGDPPPRHISPLSAALVISLQSRKSITDIAHVLALPAVPLYIIVDTLKGAWLAFDINLRSGVAGAFSIVDILGASVELYRTRARLLLDENETELLSSVWRNAHDMCSVAACLAAFEDCKEPEGYDLEAIWQLVSLSSWVVSFLEKLVKECLCAADLTAPSPSPNTNEVQPKLEPADDMNALVQGDTNGPHSSPLASPMLLHLAHPFILSNLIGVVMHVNRFYHSLCALTPKGENSQFARDILMDMIGCSGLDLRGIEDVLKGVMPDMGIPGKSILPQGTNPSLNHSHVNSVVPRLASATVEDAMFSLAKCHPVPVQYPFLRRVVHTLYTSTAIDKPRLFIKAADLVDGFASLSTSEQSPRKKEIDVVTKGVLIRHNPSLLCLRCGYRSEAGGRVSVSGHTSLKWRTWEKMWANRCVCGGPWINGNL
ncbi:hypothetical protein JVU11DRAFT_765 [Chiua virens]|nr:hypothetical protein JVU11DRAFT_765 [Chiua virens]